MIVIADSNLIFCCLYTPRGVVASILKSPAKIQFITPDIIFNEVGNHLPKIVEYTGKTRKQVVNELKEITKGITLYSVDEIPEKQQLF
jgi:predicted nucleic acid-binding protein